MKLLLLPVLLLSIGIVAAQDATLDSWLAKQAGITSLDARFTQERKLPALKNPTSTRGRVCFVKPDRVRWQLGDPFETLAVSDGTTLTLLDASNKTARRTNVDSPQASRFSLLSGKAFSSRETFFQAFEIVNTRITEGIHQYTLKAKDRRVRAEIPWIFIDIDPAKNELRVLELELQDKSRLRTIFENPRFNAKLDDSLFHPDLTGYDVK